MNSERIEIYKGVKGEVVFNVDKDMETIWATEDQVSALFDVDRSVINRHIRNIYRDGELDETATCAKNAQVRNEGGRTVTREVKMYNLDAIISVGYRVNSRKATDFRIWATNVLRSYVVDGVAINKRRLEELDAKKLHEIEGALGIVKRLVAATELTDAETKGILEVISKYSPSLKVLKEFSEGHISLRTGKKTARLLDENECIKIVDQLKKGAKNERGFGEIRGKFGAVLEEAYAGEDVAEKAANLLYLVIKKRPFVDGNKRIAALLFIAFLTFNNYHLTNGGETKISDRALTALTLLIAESNPDEKELIVALICKLLEN